MNHGNLNNTLQLLGVHQDVVDEVHGCDVLTLLACWSLEQDGVVGDSPPMLQCRHSTQELFLAVKSICGSFAGPWEACSTNKHPQCIAETIDQSEVQSEVSCMLQDTMQTRTGRKTKLQG